MGCVVGRGDDEGGWRKCEGGEDTWSIFTTEREAQSCFHIPALLLLLVRCLKEHVPVFFVFGQGHQEEVWLWLQWSWILGRHQPKATWLQMDLLLTQAKFFTREISPRRMCSMLAVD